MNRLLFFLLLCSICLIHACKRDLCAEVACENGGVCLEGNCECPEGFEGNFCEFFDLQRYFGTYDVAYEGCFETSENHTVSLEKIAGTSSRFLIHNLGDYDCPSGMITIEAAAIVDTISIDSQTIDCGPIAYTFFGSGTFSAGNKVTIDFSVIYDAGGFDQVDNCTATLGK